MVMWLAAWVGRGGVAAGLARAAAVAGVLAGGAAAWGETAGGAASVKLEALHRLIAEAESSGVDALRERMTARTAEVFLGYAAWDEANVDINTRYFEKTAAYKTNAARLAAGLPDLQRREIGRMLDDAADGLRQLMAGRVTRRPTPDVDWARVTHDADQLTFEGRPVFLTDWTWKPRTEKLTEFHGQEDGFFLSHTFVESPEGRLSRRVVERLEKKPDGQLGFVFLHHKSTPGWADAAYGPGFRMREQTYTAYDIDHPGARELNRLLLGAAVPYMAGKKYRDLGYMLCNEPHFFTTEGVWATGPVSSHTIDKFRGWLAERHGHIDALNGLWGSSFSGFGAVEIEVPISKDLQGTPKWFDWVSFNMDRVTDWYRFLKAEIRRHDPSAKVHLKVMPSLWTENQRNHGIDMEALTRMSEIIGNDAGADYKLMWGRGDWEDTYAFGWREMCMAHDFYKSIAPDKIMYNTELHFLSTVRSRDLDMDPAYVRATFWLAHTQGLTASQNWYWARREDGSIRPGEGGDYAGSNNQQPRVVNEVHATVMDLNAHAEEIMAMQRQRKPIRIFYTKASSINKPAHMDDLFELYESLHTRGVPLGFATGDLLNEQDSAPWDMVLVYQTEFATEQDVAALEAYVAAGGRVIVDGESLRKDAYGRPIAGLAAGDGVLRAGSMEAMGDQAMRVVAERGRLPPVELEQNSPLGVDTCVWKCVENDRGNPVVSAVNLGKEPVTLSLGLRGENAPPVVTDLLTGRRVPRRPTLEPFGVLFVEVERGADAGGG